ncbi:MAG: helix-turn-helix domain-containing protein [Desulfovibrionaceae bacterium]|nr:helix-turn-helix domain-containing protein [Desulfovibrionaceae bacterium]
MGIQVDEYSEIRKRALEGESQRQIAKDLGISRKTVKKYCDGAAVPLAKTSREREATVVTDEVVAFFESCLEGDERDNLKKQKHAARRIYDRLVEEKGFTGGESTIRRKVREIKERSS